MILYKKRFVQLLAVGTLSTGMDFFMSLVDVSIMGHFLPSEALSGVALLQFPIMIADFICRLLLVGSTTMFLSALGRFDQKESKRVFCSGFWSALGFGVVFACLMLPSGELYLNWFHVSEIAYRTALSYWNVYAYTVLIQPLAFFLTYMVYADGGEKLSLISNILQTVINIVFSLVLCRIMGAAGCAVGTMISFAAATVILSSHFFSKKSMLKPGFSFSWRISGKIIVMSLGDTSIALFSSIVNFVITSILAKRFGAEFLPLAAIITTFLSFMVLFDGVPVAAQPMIELYQGERNYRRMRDVLMLGLRTALLEGSVFALLTFIWPDWICMLLGISDPVLLGYGRIALRIVSFIAVLKAIISFLFYYLVFLSHPFFSVLLTFLDYLLFPVIFLAVGAFSGITGMWIGLALASPAALALFIAVMYKKFGKAVFDFLIPRNRDERLFSWNLSGDKKQLQSVLAEVMKTVKSCAETKKYAAKLFLLLEDGVLMTYEKNNGKKFQMEINLDMNPDDVTKKTCLAVVTYDNGIYYDMEQPQKLSLSTVRPYAFSKVFFKMTEHQRLSSAGFNRAMIRFP